MIIFIQSLEGTVLSVIFILCFTGLCEKLEKSWASISNDTSNFKIISAAFLILELDGFQSTQLGTILTISILNYSLSIDIIGSVLFDFTHASLHQVSEVLSISNIIAKNNKLNTPEVA